jgi:hypothetical protein
VRAFLLPACVVFADQCGDIDALKETELWVFSDAPAKQTARTGLSNAGAASDNDKQ